MLEKIIAICIVVFICSGCLLLASCSNSKDDVLFTSVSTESKSSTTAYTTETVTLSAISITTSVPAPSKPITTDKTTKKQVKTVVKKPAAITSKTPNVQNISADSKKIVKQYEKYSVGGLFPTVAWEDVAKACNSKASENKITFGNFTFYSFGNSSMLSATVDKGSYNGVTVGKSTRKTADKAFSEAESKNYSEGDADRFNVSKEATPGVIYASSTYENFPDYPDMTITVYYINGIVDKIGVFCGDRTS